MSENDLSALAAQCSEVDALTAPAAQANVLILAPPAPDVLIAEVKMLLGVARPMFELGIPHLTGAPQAAWDALIEPIAELMRHYNVTAAQILTNPWAKLAIAAIPLTMHGYQNAIAAKKVPEQSQPSGNADADSQPAAIISADAVTLQRG